MLTIITEIIASEGSLSQLIRPVMRPRRNSVQLITLNVGSNIHFHANVDSTVGMMNGSRTKARVSALPLKWRVSMSAPPKASGPAQNRGWPGDRKGVYTAPGDRASLVGHVVIVDTPHAPP